jgi:hypothetical protein
MLNFIELQPNLFHLTSHLLLVLQVLGQESIVPRGHTLIQLLVVRAYSGNILSDNLLFNSLAIHIFCELFYLLSEKDAALCCLHAFDLGGRFLLVDGVVYFLETHAAILGTRLVQDGFKFLDSSCVFFLRVGLLFEL